MLRRGLFALAAVALAAPAAAEDALAARRELRLSLGGSLNPAGVQNGFDLAWTRPLSRSTRLLLRDAHTAGGLSLRITPAYARLGPWVEVAPLSVLEVRAGVDGAFYYGTFHSLQRFEGYADPFDDDARKARSGADAGTALRVYVAPALKARAGPVVLRVRAELERWTLDAPGPFVYEPSRDTLLRSSGDSLLATETVLLWTLREEEPRRLLVGPFHEMTLVFDARANRRQLAGLLAVWGLGERRLGFASPVALLKAGRYFEDPNREGGFALQAGISVGLR